MKAVGQDNLENLLLLWGYAFGPLSASSELSYFGDSPLAAFGQVRTIRQTAAMDRPALARRRVMGEAAGLHDAHGHTLLAPRWAVGAVRCNATRTASARRLGVGAPEFSPEVMRVEQAALQLLRVDHVLGAVLRAEYCTLGGQGDKAGRFNLRRGAYRERVAEARGWMRCRLAS